MLIILCICHWGVMSPLGTVFHGLVQLALRRCPASLSLVCAWVAPAFLRCLGMLQKQNASTRRTCLIILHLLHCPRMGPGMAEACLFPELCEFASSSRLFKKIWELHQRERMPAGSAAAPWLFADVCCSIFRIWFTHAIMWAAFQWARTYEYLCHVFSKHMEQQWPDAFR